MCIRSAVLSRRGSRRRGSSARLAPLLAGPPGWRHRHEAVLIARAAAAAARAAARLISVTPTACTRRGSDRAPTPKQRTLTVRPDGSCLMAAVCGAAWGVARSPRQRLRERLLGGRGWPRRAAPEAGAPITEIWRKAAASDRTLPIIRPRRPAGLWTNCRTRRVSATQAPQRIWLTLDLLEDRRGDGSCQLLHVDVSPPASAGKHLCRVMAVE